jgi:hypothetical protein
MKALQEPATESQIMRECNLFLKGHARFLAGHKKARRRIGVGFLKLLGCGYMLGNTGKSCPTINASEDIDAIRDCLPRLLVGMGPDPTAPVDVTFVLAGMWRHDCWRSCLQSEDAAYVLAAGLIGYLETYLPSYQPDFVAADDICALLNAWLRPPTPWQSIPSAGEACSHLFNNGWCAMRLPEEESDIPDSLLIRGRYITELITKERPPFLLGLCPAQQRAQSVPLPDDLGFAA